MQIETSRGIFEKSALREEIVVVDGPDFFAYDYVYREVADGEVLAHFRDVKFRKENPFEVTPEWVETTIGSMRTSGLEKKVGQVDNENEFSCWVEYRRPGSTEIVHRSADVKLKKVPASAQPTAGGF